MPPGSSEITRILVEHGVDVEELAEKYHDFNPVSVDGARVAKWLAQFKEEDRLLAIRLGKQLEYFGTPRVMQQLRTLHELVLQRLSVEGKSIEDARFFAAGRAGESGGELITRYRNANGLTLHSHLFNDMRDLMMAGAGSNKPAFVFVDDFIGSGHQVVKYWDDMLSQLISPPYTSPLLICTVLACEEGIRHIQENTPLEVVHSYQVPEACYLTNDQNPHYNAAELATLRGYCESVESAIPFGYGKMGLCVSMYSGPPTNSISIIRGSRGQRPWIGLLPRYDDINLRPRRRT